MLNVSECHFTDPISDDRQAILCKIIRWTKKVVAISLRYLARGRKVVSFVASRIRSLFAPKWPFTSHDNAPFAKKPIAEIYDRTVQCEMYGSTRGIRCRFCGLLLLLLTFGLQMHGYKLGYFVYELFGLANGYRP